MSIDDEVFKQNLLLTQLYCEQQLHNRDKNYASILRSYNPEVDENPCFEFNQLTYDLVSYFTSRWTFDPLSGWYRDFFYDFLGEQISTSALILREKQV